MSLTDTMPEAMRVEQVWPPRPSLDDRIAEIVGLVNVATAELVTLVGEALATGAWEGVGIRSPEHWVTWKCGVSPTRARRLVALARGLAELPETRRVFTAGELTEDQTAVIVRHTDAAHDAAVAALAVSCTVPQLNRVLPTVPRAGANPDGTGGDGKDADGADADGGVPGGEPGDGSAPPSPPPAPTAPRDLGNRRLVSMGYGDDGGFWCSIKLPGDEGALFERGLTEARNVEFRERHPDAGHDAAVETRGVTWADALLRLVETGLSALDTATAAGRPPSERTQVVVHVDAEGETPPRLHLGPVLPQPIADHLSCDATIRYLLLRDGVPVARGRRERTVAPGLRIIVEDRDQSCRVPGCGHHRWLHIHHLVHWREGGATDPANLLALCPTHHRMVHKGLLMITGDPTRADGLRFVDDRGRELVPARPQPPAAGTPPAAAAVAYGLPDPGWNHPLGERLDGRWLSWD
ncbi:MAG TPA: DUF222 domain-containing protein [Acidimicrobiales bacterium]